MKTKGECSSCLASDLCQKFHWKHCSYVPPVPMPVVQKAMEDSQKITDFAQTVAVREVLDKCSDIIKSFLWNGSTEVCMKWCEWETNAKSIAEEYGIEWEYEEDD